MKTSQKPSGLYIGSVEKAFKVLECFRDARTPLTMGQLAIQTGYTKSAVQRAVFTLIELGYLARNADGGLQSGSKCLDMAFQFLQPNPLIAMAYPVLLKIRDTTGERTNLSFYDRDTLVYAIRLQSTKDYGYLTSLIGRRLPTFCTAGGRAMLSCLPREEAMQIIVMSPRESMTPFTKTAPNEIMACVDEARSAGFARVMSEIVTGEVSIAAAVVNKQGLPVAAIHISSSLAHWTPDDFQSRFAPIVVEVAQSLSDFRRCV